MGNKTHSVWGLEAPHNTRLRLVLYGALTPPSVLYYSYSTPVHALTIMIVLINYSIILLNQAGAACACTINFVHQ